MPPEIASQVHHDWRKNEAAYWAVRDHLLGQYSGQWIAFADGAVIVTANTPLDVFLAIQKTDRHPFVIRVAHEEEPWYRIRRTSFPYDPAYPIVPLPIADVEFRVASGSPGLILNRVIPDTGADTTTLPWSDCQRLHLDPTAGVPRMIRGAGGTSVMTMGFLVWVWLDGQEYPCQLQGDFAARERILGRDVLNRLRVLFDGPNGEVVCNP